MSTVGYFLIIKIKKAKEIGIINAAKFPDIWPGERDDPIINIIPVIAKMIEITVVLDIFSLRNKKPNIAKKIVCVWIIKLVFATVVLYIAKT